MKRLFVIIFLVSSSLFCQNGISISVLHDVKLGLGMDKEHGNDKPTLDVIANINWEGKQFEYYYFAIQLQFEKANLHGGDFYRYSVGGIWNLNSLLAPKLKLGFGAGAGVIHRENGYGLLNFSGILDMAYPFSKKLSVIAKNEWVSRPDLNNKIKYNFSIGLSYKLINI